jgi:tetratricopeptide (TPR) repeat protein
VNAADQMIVRETRRTSPNWEKVAMVMSTRGEALVSLGEFERAIEQLHSLITLLEKRTLDLPELTARAHNGLANAYVTTRQLEQADLHSRESLRILETAGLLDSSNGLQAQVNRAGLLSLIGRPDDAEAQYLQSIERMQNRFGPSHPWVVWATTSLGVMYNSRGEPQRAVEVMEPLLADVENTLPNDDETSACFKAKLGYALCQAQRPASGLSLLEESLAARKLIYPPGNWNIPDAEMAIGYCHMKLGQDAQARSVLLRAKSNFIEIYGQEYRSVGSIDQWLADIADDR